MRPKPLAVRSSSSYRQTLISIQIVVFFIMLGFSRIQPVAGRRGKLIVSVKMY